MITIKTSEDIKVMAEGGRLLASILKKMEAVTVAGVTT